MASLGLSKKLLFVLILASALIDFVPAYAHGGGGWGGHGGWHGGGGWGHGGWGHGGWGYGGWGGYYPANNWWGGSTVIIGAPGYYDPYGDYYYSAPNYFCPTQTQCYPNGDCNQVQVCNY